MIDNIGLDQLRVLIAIADQGSFSKAGRHLRRAQSAISYAIANLEETLDVQLFDRTEWKPRLTPHGVALLKDARAVLERVDQMKARARGLAQGLEPELSLVADAMLPTHHLVEIASGLRRTFPSVALRLRTEVLGGVPEMVVSRRYQLGIQGKVSIAPELVSYPLFDVALVPVLAPSHPLSQQRRILARSLDEEVQIILADTSGQTEGLTFSVLSSNHIIAGDLGSKQAMLRAGLGWGYMPENMVEHDLNTGRLVKLDLASRNAANVAMPLLLIHRADESLGPAGKWLADLLIGLE